MVFAWIAFKLWMLIDAAKRRAEGYWFFIILMPLGAVAYFLVNKLPDLRRKYFPGHARSSPQYFRSPESGSERVSQDQVRPTRASGTFDTGQAPSDNDAIFNKIIGEVMDSGKKCGVEPEEK